MTGGVAALIAATGQDAMASARKSKSASSARKSAASSGPEQVAQFMARLDHPLKKGVEAVRAIILGSNRGITEQVKWNAPSFCFDGQDRVTLNLRRDDCILLVFHQGAKVKDRKGSGPAFQDATGLLEWLSDDRAIVRLHSLREVNAKQEQLGALVARWIAVTRGS